MSDGYSSNDLGLRPARELLSMLSSREVSSVELLEHFVERNSRLHDQLNAIVTLDLNRAFETAKSVDDRRAGNLGTGLLEGLPMTIKDAIAVEGVRSTGGAVELRDHVPSRDAEVVSALRSQGAIIFGKTNLPRWSGDIQAHLILEISIRIEYLYSLVLSVRNINHSLTIGVNVVRQAEFPLICTRLSPG